MAYHLARALYTKSKERLTEGDIRPGDVVSILLHLTPLDRNVCNIIRSFVTSIDMIAITSMEHRRFYFTHFHCYSKYIQPLIEWRKENKRSNPDTFSVWYTGDYEDPNPYNSPIKINGIKYSMRKHTLNVVVCHNLFMYILHIFQLILELVAIDCVLYCIRIRMYCFQFKFLCVACGLCFGNLV